MTVPDNPIYYLEALDRAEVFYGAFRQLPPEETITKSWPRYFLLCHAIELALDAFLASRGVKPKDLPYHPFGLMIEPLTDAAIARGLKIDTSAADAIKRLDEAHRNYLGALPSFRRWPYICNRGF